MYDLDSFMAEVERKNPAQPEFIQAGRSRSQQIFEFYVPAGILASNTDIIN